MSFVDIPGGGATVPEHNRLRGLDRGDPHPQYVLAAESDSHQHEVSDSGWITATLEGAWANLASYEPTRYRKVGGAVYLGGGVGSGSKGTTVFTLPGGFCPDHDLRIAAAVYDGGVRYPAIIYVTTAGAVQLHSETAATDPIGEANLSGISFLAAT